MTVECADLHPQQGRFPAETQRTDSQPVRVVQNPFFEIGKNGIGIRILQRTQKLVFGMEIA